MGLGSALAHGAVMAALASALIVGVLRFAPRLMMRHFPEAVRERIGPLTPAERRVGGVIGLALLAILLGGAWLSAWRLAQAQPEAGLLQLWVNAFVALMVFNLVDWLVLDELWLGLFRPRWVIPAGAEDLEIAFDHAQHARGFVTGTVLSAVLAGAAALIVWSLTL